MRWLLLNMGVLLFDAPCKAAEFVQCVVYTLAYKPLEISNLWLQAGA